jgi:hypothetical protein
LGELTSCPPGLSWLEGVGARLCVVGNLNRAENAGEDAGAPGKDDQQIF